MALLTKQSTRLDVCTGAVRGDSNNEHSDLAVLDLACGGKRIATS